MNYLPSCDLIVFVFMGPVYKIDAAAGRAPPQRLLQCTSKDGQIYLIIITRNEALYFICVAGSCPRHCEEATRTRLLCVGLSVVASHWTSLLVGELPGEWGRCWDQVWTVTCQYCVWGGDWVGTELRSCERRPRQLLALPVITREGRMDVDRRQKDLCWCLVWADGKG